MLFAKEHIYQNIAISLLGQLRPDAALGLPALSRLKRQLSSPPRSLSGARSSKQKDHKQLSALLRTIRNITHGRNLAVLARILRSKQHIHRLFAARQLGHLPTQQKQAIGLLLQHLKREHQIAVKLTLIGSLAKLPITKSEQNAVLRRLNGMNEGVEKRALKSLLRPAKPEPLLLHLPRLRQRRSGLKHSTRNTRRQPGQGSLLQVLRKLRLRHEFRKSRRHRLFPPRTSFRQQVLRGHAALLALKKQGALTPQAKAAFTRLAREIIFAPPDPKPCSWGGGLNASPRLSFIENLQMDLLYEEFVRQLLQHH
jgi:hypothetical protein